MTKILEFTPPIRKNYLETAIINVLQGEEIKKIRKYKRRVANRNKLHKKKKKLLKEMRVK